MMVDTVNTYLRRYNYMFNTIIKDMIESFHMLEKEYIQYRKLDNFI